jgi:hypothetical protein
MKSTVCEECGWFVKTTRTSRGKASTHAPAALLGAPCPACNSTNDGDAPRMPGGFKIKVDKDGWRH